MPPAPTPEEQREADDRRIAEIEAELARLEPNPKDPRRVSLELELRRLKDEKGMVELLDQLNPLAEDDPRRKSLEDRFFFLFDRNLREVLKPFLEGKFPGLLGHDGAARFTEMINDFFMKVVTKRPDAIWKAQSTIEIRKWTSVVVTNQILDRLRLRGSRRHEFRGDGLDALIEDRQTWFHNKTGLELSAEVLEQVDQWCESTNPRDRLHGRVLRHRYIDGMPWVEIGRQLGMTDYAAPQAHNEAVQRLKDLF